MPPDLEGLEGFTCSKEWIAEEGHAALHLKHMGLQVLATPYMLLYGEVTARECLDQHLPAGMASVGVEALVRHLAPIPVGSRVMIEARIISVDGKGVSIVIRVKRHDGTLAGEIYHVRRIVRLEELKKRIKQPHS
ncbi:conserved hypothetical protein [Aeropyrum pernix K1]|uniref:Fluoroacetyl-CoA-specific thioesterase-like domain-containing protein n=1 Tax=Aeropyrum pernix (strain ATCC 700893 / DSM 11879 / JCM 9820 / NBRC 100138 / K1) TaxID=272557 RepID=Q9Y8Y5_AERPE|nr:thioesterase family protein [Aeropyrum pernix]BAA81515.2 conserved hypothetical protein [Aeropyrum pernix K1]